MPSLPSDRPLHPPAPRREGPAPLLTQDAADADPLIDQLVEDMIRRWQVGERPLTEDYLAQHPDLRDRPQEALELLYEEICLCQEYGSGVDEDEVLRRFPSWREPLRLLLGCHQVLSGKQVLPRFPEAGDDLGGFHLLAELGRGSQGRVFLARQAALSDRLVVLKLTPRGSGEHLALARLQHTHIVPLYSTHEDPARHLSALCMPYFGGGPLDRVLEGLPDLPPGQRTGQHLLDALDRVVYALPAAATASAPSSPQQSRPASWPAPARQFLAGSSHAQAICWIGACLADALHYAGARGLVHLDLKPSNVLLAADGQPMLLDFHLARAPIPEGAPAPAWLGGTPGYMAPEQQQALTAVQEGRPVPVAVDGRADLYSLGLLLYQALDGTFAPRLPQSAGGVRSVFSEELGAALRRRNPQVTPGLADILARCLADDPGERYPDAAALADDLRRHLADLPLRGVANRSLTERWRKWRRRRPHALPVLGLVLGALVVGVLVLVQLGQQARKAEDALAEGREHLRQHHYDEAASALERGLALAEESPFLPGLTRELREELRSSRRGQAAVELHRFAERLRTLYGAASAWVPAEARVLEVRCRAFWDRRADITRLLEPEPGAGLGAEAQTDLLDLAILWAELRVRLAGPEQPVLAADARRQALEVLAQAEELFGPSCVLYRERQAHAAALGLTEDAREAGRRAAGLGPRTAWEHYALGRALLRSGHLEQAAATLDRALDLQPGSFWAHYDRGRCSYQQGHYDDAVAAFTACAALAPNSAWCRYNRGLAHAELGRPEDALRDYTSALRLEPDLAPAALNRGLLHYQQGRYAKAEADFSRARDHGADPAVVGYDLALVHLARGDRDAALASLTQALRHNPKHQEARALRDRLLRQP